MRALIGNEVRGGLSLLGAHSCVAGTLGVIYLALSTSTTPQKIYSHHKTAMLLEYDTEDCLDTDLSHATSRRPLLLLPDGRPRHDFSP